MKDLKEIIPSLYLDVWLRWVLKLSDVYKRQGGIPFIIPPVDETNSLINSLNALDGLLLTGGADINPLFPVSYTHLLSIRITINIKRALSMLMSIEMSIIHYISTK